MLSHGRLLFRQIMSIIALVIGIPNALFWGLGLCAVFGLEPEEVGSFLIVCSVFVAIAILFVVAGVSGLRFVRLCKGYSSVLTSRNAETISQLAGILGSDVIKTRKNLRKMLSRQYIKGLYLDHGNDTIVYIDQMWETVDSLVAVKCSCCGGITMLPHGKTAKCGYCDSVIQSS